MQENAYEPPRTEPSDARGHRTQESWLVRVVNAGLALTCLAVLINVDYRSVNATMVITVAVFGYCAFWCAYVAFTGRWFQRHSVRKVFSS